MERKYFYLWRNTTSTSTSSLSSCKKSLRKCDTDSYVMCPQTTMCLLINKFYSKLIIENVIFKFTNMFWRFKHVCDFVKKRKQVKDIVPTRTENFPIKLLLEHETGNSEKKTKSLFSLKTKIFKRIDFRGRIEV